MAAGRVEDGEDVVIDLRAGDGDTTFCTAYPTRFYAQFTSPHPADKKTGVYENGVSILDLREGYDAWWGSIPYGRRRVRRALRAGYVFRPIDRNEYLDDIYQINTSKDVRQGKPMTDAYRQPLKPTSPLPRFDCPAHAQGWFGVIREDHVFAYANVYQVGEVSILSTILGHADHMDDGVMFLLVDGIAQNQLVEARTKYIFYNHHSAGGPGLVFFKENLGFRPRRVRWEGGGVTPRQPGGRLRKLLSRR